jgi:hypothetical protein
MSRVDSYDAILHVVIQSYLFSPEDQAVGKALVQSRSAYCLH